MLRNGTKLSAALLIALGLVVAGGSAANAYDGTRGCASSSTPVTFSYTQPNAGQPNKHRHVNLSNTAQSTESTKWEGGNKTTYSTYRQIGYYLSGSNKSSYCS